MTRIHIGNTSGALRNYATIALACMTLAGCAVQQGASNRTQIGLDQAAVFGKQVASIVLPDGSDASLRELGQRYSLKFSRYAQVVPIEQANAVRFVSAQEVDGYTLIVLDASEPNCPVKTHLVAVKGAQVHHWDLGDCHSVPDSEMVAGAMRFDLRHGAFITRYVFSQGRLSESQLPAPRPAQAPALAQAGAIPAPVVASRAEATSPAPAPAPTSASAPVRADAKKPARTSAVLPASSLVFGAKEQAPRTIYLDR